MKFFALIAILVIGFVNSNANAQDVSGSVRLRDGRTILRINVGDQRDDRDSASRIYRLEQAVRDLQDQVYQLQSEGTSSRRPITVFTCSLKTNFDGTFIGKASTQVEARANAVNNCNRANGSFCESTKQICESSVEYR